MRVGSLFSGAGGFDLGFHAAGFELGWLAEIEPAARAVLETRWPDVPLYGDVCDLRGDELPDVDIIIGGSPCQDLSVAGKRAGLEGMRSGLFHQQVRIWRESSADLVLWENVDGARSSNGGADFAVVLSTLVGAPVPVPSDGWRSGGVAVGDTGIAAWRVLDAQFFGVPQRRRRIFVLCSRAGRIDPAQVLALGESVPWDTEARGETGEGAASGVGAGTEGGGIAFSETGRGWWAEGLGPIRPSPGGIHAMLAFHATQDPISGKVAPSLGATAYLGTVDTARCVTAGEGTRNDWETCTIVADTLGVGANQTTGFKTDVTGGGLAGRPRRLTPLECERLMGWPDNHTLVPFRGKPMSDAARYRLCGNGVAAPVAEWIAWQIRGTLGGTVKMDTPETS